MNETITYDTHQSIVNDLHHTIRGLIVENSRLRLAATLATEVIEALPSKTKTETDALAMLRMTLEKKAPA